MYTSFYNLKRKPFQISSDPSFLWLGEKHLEALATLKYGILDNRGFLLLTGDVGTGKTTVVNALLQSLDSDVIRAFVPDPNLERMEFYNYISQGFGIDESFSSKGTFLKRFHEFLNAAHDGSKKVLLIIDESQLLTQELLEEIRLLSNIERADTKLLNIFFVGQNEFNDILSRNQNRAVRQRITINYNIQTLSIAETTEYVKYRLKVAGTTDPIFDDGAMQEIYRWSQGYPRRINVICDHALLTGFVRENRHINASIIRDCAKEVTVPGAKNRKDFDSGVPEIEPAAPQVSQTSARSVPQSDSIGGRKQGARVHRRPVRSRFSGFRKGIGVVIAGILLLLYGLYPGEFTRLLDPGTFKNKTVVFPVRETGPETAPDMAPGSGPGSEHQGEAGAAASGVDTTKDAVAASTTPVIDTAPSGESAGPPDRISPAPLLSPVQELRPPLPKETILIRFNSSTTEINDQGRMELDVLAGILIQYPEATVEVRGYTDASGYVEKNQRLSEERAEKVRHYLILKGVAKDAVTAVGKGSDDPISSNDTIQGRIINRRVEISVHSIR